MSRQYGPCVKLNGGEVIIDISAAATQASLREVDPTMVYAAAKAAVDYYQHLQLTAWQQSVGDKLDAIFDKLTEIVNAIHDAVTYLVENNNENWQSYLSTKIRGPGSTWANLAIKGKPLADSDRKAIANGFDRLAEGIEAITEKDEFKSWGFVLVEVVRSAFPFTLLALKLVPADITTNYAQAAVVDKILSYLERSVSVNEPLSFPNSLTQRSMELASHIAIMETWCNRWVRVSNELDGGPEAYSSVLVGLMSGGAMNPAIGGITIVDSTDDRFYVDYYPDFPGNIGVNEGEKAEEFCNRRIVAANKLRQSLGGMVALLGALIPDIRREIELIKAWLASTEA
jgi:hypothetical protein